MSTWSEYVSTVTNGVGIDAAGKLVGVDGSTISRWRNGVSEPRNPAEAAALAVAFHVDVLGAFVAAGYLTPEQAQRPARVDLGAVAPEALAAEVRRRLVGESVIDGGDVKRPKARNLKSKVREE